MFQDIIGSINSFFGDDEKWDRSNRRQLMRLLCRFDVLYEQNGRTHKGEVVDMSIKGMKLRGSSQLKVGSIVSVTLPVKMLDTPIKTVKCKVLWSHSSGKGYICRSGLVYAEDKETMKNSWVPYQLKKLGLRRSSIHDRREYPRVECLISGNMWESEHTCREIRLLNIGVGGFLFDSYVEPKIGKTLEFDIGPLDDLYRFRVKGIIRKSWQDRGKFFGGVEFVDLKPNQEKMVMAYLNHLFEKHWKE